MKKNIIIIIFIILINNYLSHIVIPFKGNNLTQIFNSNPKKDFLEDFIMSTFYNQIYTAIGIGLPTQNIVLNIVPAQIDFVFNKINCLFFYNNIYIDKNNLSPNNRTIPINITKIGYIKNSSKSFSKNNNLELSISYQNNNYFSGKEKLKIDDYRNVLSKYYNDTRIFPYVQNNLVKFGFIYEETNIDNNNEENEEICGSFGLKLFFKKNNNKFIEKLKSINITNNYYWSFNYTSLDKGYIIIGILPHEYNPNEFKVDNLVEEYTSFEEGNKKWAMDLNNIYFIYNNKKIYVKNEIAVGLFEFTLQLIVGSFQYQELITKYFFQEFYNKNICLEEEYKLDIKYSIIRCKKNDFQSKVKTFPDLFLYNLFLQNSFKLSYEDLFIIIDNYIYFLVIFRKDDLYKMNNTWKLGIPFLKRYQIIFNSDTKRIGYYVKKNKDIKDNNNKSDDSKGFLNFIKNAISLRTFFEIIIIIIFIFILIYFKKKLYISKIKRKKPYELQDEDYDYFSNNNKRKKDNSDINNSSEDNNFIKGQIIEMKSH